MRRDVETDDPAISAADQELLEFVASRVMAAAGSEWEEQFICDLAASPRPLTPQQREVIEEIRRKAEIGKAES